MRFHSIALERTANGEYIVVLLDEQLHNPFMKTSRPLSREDAEYKLRELEVPDREIARLFADADRA